jgi:hypothetical protein
VAQALKTVLVEGVTLAESVPTVGIALGAVDEDGLAWVLVNPQLQVCIAPRSFD